MKNNVHGMKAFARLFFRTSVFRFVIGGMLNTGLTFLIYWLLMLMLDYQAAYAISYVIGIVLSYLINSRMVFRVRRSIRSAALYPLVYLAGYAVGAAVLAVGVEVLGINPWLAPILSVCITLPLTYVLTRIVLMPRVHQ